MEKRYVVMTISAVFEFATKKELVQWYNEEGKDWSIMSVAHTTAKNPEAYGVRQYKIEDILN